MESDSKEITCISILKQITTWFNLKCDISIMLFLPCEDPINLIDKSDEVVLEELKTKIASFLIKYNDTKEFPLGKTQMVKFLGYSEEELKKIATKFAIYFPITQISGKDLDKSSIKKGAISYVSNTLNYISDNMLCAYIKESGLLIQDYNNYTSKNLTIGEWTPMQAKSTTTYFKIAGNNKEKYYNSVRDAIKSNDKEMESVR